MNTVKRILYSGLDSDFASELSNYMRNYGIGEFEFKHISYEKDKLISLCSESFQNIVFIDCSSNDLLADLLSEVLFLKKHSKLRKTLFAGVFSTKMDFEKSENILTNGFQLFYIKGTESEILFRDAFYIAFDDSTNHPAFSRAKKIDQEIIAGACSTINYLQEHYMALETDITIAEDAITTKIPMFPDLKCESFTVIKKNHYSTRFDMLNTLLIELPMTGVWDEISNATLQQDTLKTWMDLNSDLILSSPLFVKVFTENVDLVKSLYHSINPQEIQLRIYSEVDLTLLTEDLFNKPCHLIFFDLNISEDLNNSLKDLENIVRLVSTQPENKTIIISSRNPSSGQAMRKLLNYETILCDKRDLELKTFLILIKNYLDRRSHNAHPAFYLPSYSSHRCLEIKIPVTLTSLSEHEITFISDFEFPMFSVLSFTLPLPFIVTIVPPLFELSLKHNKFHYMGIINGVSEKDLEVLRMFINQIIYEPLSDYKEITLAKLLKDLIAEGTITKQTEVVLNANASVDAKVDKSDYVRDNIKTKTKL